MNMNKINKTTSFSFEKNQHVDVKKDLHNIISQYDINPHIIVSPFINGTQFNFLYELQFPENNGILRVELKPTGCTVFTMAFQRNCDSLEKLHYSLDKLASAYVVHPKNHILR